MIRLERRAAAVLVFVLMLMGISCGGKDSTETRMGSDPPVVIPAQKWVPKACAFLADVQEAVGGGIFDDVDVSDVESRDGRASLRDELDDLLTDRRDRLQEIADDFGTVGVSDTRGGVLLRDVMLRGLTRTIERFDRMASRAGDVDVEDLERFQAGLGTSIGELEQAMTSMGEAREALFADPSLAEVIRTTPECNNE